MGRLGVSVVSGAGSAALTDQASLFALLTEHGIYHGGLQVGVGARACAALFSVHSFFVLVPKSILGRIYTQ